MTASAEVAGPRFTDQVAVITGAGGGIGSRLAMRFAGEGATVVLLDKDIDAANTVAAEIEGHGQRAKCYGVDITEAGAVRAAFDDVLKSFGRIDILVNNAGGIRDGRIQALSDEAWDEVVNLNLRAAFLCCRGAVVPMVERRYGRIVNIASMAYLGNAGQTNYSAAKAGLVGLTRALGLEVATRGITVNCVSPGLIETARSAQLPAEVLEKLSATIPMRRAGSPDDIAEAVSFFASPAAGFVTRQVLHVSGGHEGF
jgi:3-oxoacyl-[acyl-carrier protein] reductase